jgi:membrane protein YdbS with pleckstrin-like domain
MENNFEDIQKLWQAQKPIDFDINSLMEGLRKTEVKQRREMIFMMLITPLTIGFLFWSMPWRESIGIAISLYIIAFAMIWVLGLTLRSKVRKNDSSERFSNSDYLKAQIKKLNFRYEIARKHMYAYTFLLILALNISYYILLEPLNAITRVGIHLALTLAILGFMHWQIKRKVKKYDKELKPMIEQMKGMLVRKGD